MKPEELMEKYGLNANAIVEKAEKVMSRKQDLLEDFIGYTKLFHSLNKGKRNSRLVL